MNEKYRTAIWLAPLLFWCSSAAWSSGFMLFEYSASEIGTGFAGAASAVDDASAIYSNPAALPKSRAEISSGVSYIDPRNNISGARGSFPGSNEGDMVAAATVPFVYASIPLHDDVAAGVGFFVPFGLATEYEENFQGRYFGTKSSIRVLTVQPVVGWQLNSQWALGGGVNWNSVEGELSRAIPNPLTPGTNDLNARVKGDSSAWGYIVGASYKTANGATIGVTYHSEVKPALKGNTRISLPGVGDIRYDSSVDLVLPEVLDMSVSQSLRNGWALHASVMRTGWSSFDELRVKSRGAEDVVEPQGWDDVNRYAIGITRKINRDWLIRAGVAYDRSPIPNITRGVRLPSDDRFIYCMGGRWSAAEKFSVDFGYAYVDQRETEVAQQAGEISYSATYETSVHNLRAQLNWYF